MSNHLYKLASIAELTTDLRAGKMIILIDEEDRENEGDLVVASDLVTPEIINFMATYGRGLICLTLTRERCQQLNLPLMVSNNGTSQGTNFTVSIEAATGVTTGISAADRAQTIQTAVAPKSRPQDLVQPGHVFPLMAQQGGVLVRAGHTEAGCDLAALAGCSPSSVICEIMNDDGSMARLPDLITFANLHQIKIGSIADLIKYRSQRESIVIREGEREFITPWGVFNGVIYRDKSSSSIHLALVKGQPNHFSEALVRVHEPTTILDLLELGATTHSWPIADALQAISTQSTGVLLMLNVAGNGAPDADEWLKGFHKLAELDPKIGQKNMNNFRMYGIGSQILKDLNVRKIHLLASAGPSGLSGYEIEIVGHTSFQNKEIFIKGE